MGEIALPIADVCTPPSATSPSWIGANPELVSTECDCGEAGVMESPDCDTEELGIP
jgi:hypothetical protein